MTRTGRMHGTIALVLSALLMACGSSGSSGSTSNPGGTIEVTPAPTPIPTPAPTSTSSPTAAGILDMHFTLAANWQSVDMTEAALTAEVEALKGTNSVLAQALQQLLASGAYKSIRFYAIGYTGVEPIGNLVATAGSLPGIATLDAVKPYLEGALKQMGGSELVWSARSLPAGDTDVADLVLTLNQVDGTAIKLTDRIFNVLQDGTLYQATFTCYPSAVSTCLADADTMAAGWTIGP